MTSGDVPTRGVLVVLDERDRVAQALLLLLLLALLLVLTCGNNGNVGG
ncbi:hypothetical protein [Streptomyces monomycini]|nr:hypothetical protein [Streptomyces monomycini]